MKDIEVKQVIIINIERRGKGVEGDPIRRVLQVYDFEGNLIAENDPFDIKQNGNEQHMATDPA